jgi:hypothetical protein
MSRKYYVPTSSLQSTSAQSNSLHNNLIAISTCEPTLRGFTLKYYLPVPLDVYGCFISFEIKGEKRFHCNTAATFGINIVLQLEKEFTTLDQ